MAEDTTQQNTCETLILKSGNTESFREVFRNYYSQLYLYGYKIIQDKNVLEDTIQELFLELWNNNNTSEIQSVKAYLFKSLQYKLYKKIALKKGTPLGDSFIVDVPFEINKETLLVEEENEKERASFVGDLLNALTPRQREIVYLRFYRNMDYEEISYIMQINYQAARNLLSQSLKALKTAGTRLK
ncbi:sigma-70 family RNA polymerase sigma factor [Danxiaibacter flavus]|uniref:Sigma-70 family RNA polymerase sigma factor n=1 Tax=Danxiaibacter flavus TaxID=3049108 RepID=A0ABV3ZAU4_9BACT|nr:sigma-70 family RNA polymerase sigma factor [Chitinophagaceae bacterium DXS]